MFSVHLRDCTVHGPRIPHIVSLTRDARRGSGDRPARRRGGAKRREGRSGRMRLRRDPRDRGAPAAAPGRPQAPRATEAPRPLTARARKANERRTAPSFANRTRPTPTRRPAPHLSPPRPTRHTHTAQAHTSRPARPRLLQPLRTVAPHPKHAHECPCHALMAVSVSGVHMAEPRAHANQETS